MTKEELVRIFLLLTAEEQAEVVRFAEELKKGGEEKSL